MTMLSAENVFTFDPSDSTAAIDKATPLAADVFSQEIQLQSVSGIDHGIGIPNLYVYANVTETYDELTDLTITIRTGDTAPEGTPGSGDVLISRNALLADLVAGYKLLKPTVLPEGCKKYLWAEYAVNGDAPTVGKVHIALVRNVGSETAFPAHTS